MKLPKAFAAFAPALAAANPVAFDSAEAALDKLSSVYKHLRSDQDIESTTTCGFMMKRDGDGGIELWILPTICWPEAGGRNYV